MRILLKLIVDFGMSKTLIANDYYTKEEGSIPVKWCAPEVLNYNKFSVESGIYFLISNLNKFRLLVIGNCTLGDIQLWNGKLKK